MTQTLTPASNWDNVVLPVGGEARTIGSLIPGFQALLDRTYALREGAVAFTVDGGSYDMTAPAIIYGVGEVFTIGDDTDASEFHLAPNAIMYAENGSAIQVDGEITITGNATAVLASPLTTSGSNGRVRQRVDTVDSAGTPKTLGIDTTAGADWTGDIIYIPTAVLSGNVAYTISTTGAATGDVMTIVNRDVGGPHTATITGGGGGTVVGLVFQAGSVASVTYMFDGSKWIDIHRVYVDS